MTSIDPVNLTRREERRNATLLEIKRYAWQQMEEEGVDTLSLRKISRDMRMSSTAIFRYFRNRDDLLNALSVDAFQSQYDFLAQSLQTQSDLFGQLIALGMAYREWAIKNPVRFALTYGSPIPGFTPEWAELVPIAQRGLDFLLTLIQMGFDRNLIKFPSELPVFPSKLLSAFTNLIQLRRYQMTPQTLYLGVVVWTRIHGMVALELNGQLGILVTDPETFYRYELEALVNNLKVGE